MTAQRTAEPLMRVVRIELADELPDTVFVDMTWPVWDRLCRDHLALRSVARPVGEDDVWWRDGFPMSWVAKTAKHYRQFTPTDDVSHEIYSCLSSLCNRFWVNGVDQALEETR